MNDITQAVLEAVVVIPYRTGHLFITTVPLIDEPGSILGDGDGRGDNYGHVDIYHPNPGDAAGVGEPYGVSYGRGHGYGVCYGTGCSDGNGTSVPQMGYIT
ncbi:MAG: hypothetical protein JW395_3343 [Nitrospira sp.]|nr:hypothetical protein [Nitrospira sp.]